MKGLRNFQKFDVNGFFKDKVLAYTGVDEWKGSDGTVQGSKVRMTILQDNTDYGKGNDSNRASNIGQVVTIKSSIPVAEYLTKGPQPFATRCQLVNVSKATVYGDYMTDLSLFGDVNFLSNK